MKQNLNERNSMFMSQKTNIIKTSILSKVIYRFKATPIKIPKIFFYRNVLKILKFISNHKRPQIVKAILTKNKAGEIIFPHFKIYFKATIIRTVSYWYKNRHINQWNRIQVCEINPHIYSQPIFELIAKNIQQRKYRFSNKWCWENQISAWKEYNWALIGITKGKKSKNRQGGLHQTRKFLHSKGNNQ